ncbi:MAG: amino acid ABC transporter permease [Desulfotomaculum sp.]|nr:amino acid ABC transporter permease [Desulfotomaculum sp.]
MTDILPFLAVGAVATVKITILAVLLGFVIGLFFGLMRLSRNKLLSSIARLYISLIRGTPLLVQIFFVYFGLPKATGLNIDAFVAATSTLGVNAGAYIAEIVRAGIQSIEKGQMEAARSLGMTHFQAMRYVIWPQAFKRIVPPLGNQFIITLKDSSLLSVITVEELVRKGQIKISTTFAAFEIWALVGIMYWIMVLVISQWVNWTEERLKAGDH